MHTPCKVWYIYTYAVCVMQLYIAIYEMANASAKIKNCIVRSRTPSDWVRLHTQSGLAASDQSML